MNPTQLAIIAREKENQAKAIAGATFLAATAGSIWYASTLTQTAVIVGETATPGIVSMTFQTVKAPLISKIVIAGTLICIAAWVSMEIYEGLSPKTQ